jgi:hypothetical protein
MTSNVQAFRRDMGSKAAGGCLVHPGDVRLPMGPGVTAIPFADL